MHQRKTGGLFITTANQLKTIDTKMTPKYTNPVRYKYLPKVLIVFLILIPGCILLTFLIASFPHASGLITGFLWGSFLSHHNDRIEKWFIKTFGI